RDLPPADAAEAAGRRRLDRRRLVASPIRPEERHHAMTASACLPLSRRRLLIATALGAAAPAFAQTAAGATDGVIRIVNPYAPGGPSDTIVRLLAEGMSAELGQRVMVENKPGGGTVIGAATVAKAPPDGRTLLLATVA